jgi:LCP family protein required for cell wall assembly
VGVVLVVLAGGSILGLRALAARYDNSVNKAPLLDPQARATSPAANVPDGALNYLLIGSDARAADPGMGQRSDTIMILHIPAGHERAYLISIPRDLLVQIPADPATDFAGASDKINAAFEYGGAGTGGANLLSATISKLTGIRFDGAAIIDFSGFEKIVNLVGGIQVCVDQQVTSVHSARTYKVGCQQMTGSETLDYARQRYDLPNGDFDRQRHQQQILKGIVDKVSSAGVLANPIKLDQLVRAIAGTLTVDTNGASLESIVLALRGLRPDDLTGVEVPSHNENIDGTSYVVLDEQSASLFQGIQGATLPSWVAANPKYVNHL